MCLLRGVEVAKEDQPIADLDLRAPLLALAAGVVVCAFEAASVVGLDARFHFCSIEVASRRFEIALLDGLLSIWSISAPPISGHAHKPKPDDERRIDRKTRNANVNVAKLIFACPLCRLPAAGRRASVFSNGKFPLSGRSLTIHEERPGWEVYAIEPPTEAVSV
jgi:hypothetical protein